MFLSMNKKGRPRRRPARAVEDELMNPTLEENGIRELEQDLKLLADLYHATSDGMSHRHIAEAMGHSFAQECLREYGVQGFQIAASGIQAILETLRDKGRNQS